MSDRAKVEEFLKAARYMVLAVQLEDGSPWAVPVRLKRWNKNVFEWDSKLDTVHSRNIERRRSIAITLFDSKDDTQIGVYATGDAECISANDHGLGRYRFTATRIWVNDETHKKREVTL